MVVRYRYFCNTKKEPGQLDQDGAGRRGVIQMIKIIALVAMVLDHIGAYLVPEVLIFRVIGRLAFPLFAFSLAEGFIYSKDLGKYGLRLALAGIAAQPAYSYLSSSGKLNICFTLALGLLFLYCHYRWKWYCLALVPAFYFVEYSFYGLAVIMIFYFYISPVVILEELPWQKIKAVVSMVLASFIFFPGIQLFSIFSLPLIWYRKISLLRFPKLSSFFYVFYPAHLIVFMFLVNWL